MTSQLMSTIADTHKLTTHRKCKSINGCVVRPIVWPAPDTSWHRDLWLRRKETRHTSSASSVLCYSSYLQCAVLSGCLGSTDLKIIYVLFITVLQGWYHFYNSKGDMTWNSVTCHFTLYGMKFYGITYTTLTRKVKIVHIKNIFFLDAMTVPTSWVLYPVLTSPLSW